MKNKFRIWDKKEEKYSEEDFFINKDGKLFNIWCEYPNEIEDDERFIVEWSIGRKDKNKKDIYDGDKVKIVENKTRISRIETVENCGCSGFYPFNVTKEDNTKVYKTNSHFIEIVGNIHNI